MKKILLLAALMLSLSNVFAQTGIEATTATTLSPFATATKLLESGTATILSPFASTLASIQSRGVAGKEQLKDELAGLNADITSGVVNSIDGIRQPTLKELIIEISSDKSQMESINSTINEGSELHRIATAVTVSLFAAE